MAKRKNRTTANGTIVEKCWRWYDLPLYLIAYSYRYKVKVPNIERPLTLILNYRSHEFKEWDTVNVEYNPEKPKRCKLSKNYSY